MRKSDYYMDAIEREVEAARTAKLRHDQLMWQFHLHAALGFCRRIMAQTPYQLLEELDAA